MKESLPNDPRKKQGGMDRRAFLRGIAATLGVQAALATWSETGARAPEIQNLFKDRARRMRFDRWQELSPKEREGHIDAEITEYGNLVRSEEGHRILERGTDEEIFNLLHLAPSILRTHITGTKYDIPKEKWPSVVLPVSGKTPFDTLPQASMPEITKSGYGNGVFVDERTILTNWHVLKELANTSGASMPAAFHVGYERGIDVAYAVLPKDTPSNEATSLKLKETGRPNECPLADISDADVHGRFVAVAGIDPDPSAASDGTKIYPSVAIRVTKRLSIFLQKHGTFDDREGYRFYENAFLYIAPPGESMMRRGPSRTGSRALDELMGEQNDSTSYLMQGTSGSPVMMDGQLVGVNSRANEVSWHGMCLDVGFFHGPDVLRQAKDDGMVWNMPEVTEGSYDSYSDEGGFSEDFGDR